MEEIIIAKDVLTIAKPLVEPLVKTIIQPKLDNLKEWFKGQGVKNDLIDHAFNNKFEEYLLRTFQRCYYINTIVYPNRQIRLEDIYFASYLRNNKDNKRIKPFEIKEEFLTNNNRILISDYAGMGKSTLSKYVCNHVIKNKLGIPIFIELRKLNNENPVLSEIFNQLNPIDKSFKSEFILQLLVRGDFIIIFDGFDEIPSTSQEFLIKDLRDFISKTPKNKFILTSRPETSLSSFGDFQEFHIQPLQLNDAFKIIDKYDSLNKNKFNERLKSDIQDRQSQIGDFLRNPFLVSLLYKSYTYNKDIPTKKATFYEEVYSALYKAHDLSKDGFKRQKRSNLDIQDFRIVLRDLAFHTAKNREVEYSEQKLLTYIAKTKTHISGIEFKETNFLDDLLLSVPLIVRDGNRVKWAHKSIQDYFAAEFVCFHNKQDEILKRIYESQNEAFLNILTLIQEMDNNAFRKSILRPILEDIVEHHENSYKGFESSRDVNIRKMLTYGVNLCLLKTEPESTHNDAIKMATKMFPQLEDHFTFSSIRVGQNLYRLLSYSFNRELLDLVRNNLEHLREEGIRYKPKDRASTLLNEIDDALLVDDSKDSFLNNDQNFEITNGILADIISNRGRIKHGLWLLDIAKCRKELDKINEEIKNQDSLDILSGI